MKQTAGWDTSWPQVHKVPVSVCRERFEASLAPPLLPPQRVRMLWRDATDPAKGDWYAGIVVQEAEEWAPPAGAIWEGVSVMWDTDSSKQLACRD